MKSKNEIQQEIINTILKNTFRGIVLASMRSGKTRILLESIKKHSENNNIKNPVILLAYPNTDIKNSWVEECKKINYFPEILFTTYLSLHKYEKTNFNYFIADEAHLIGEENQLPVLTNICANNKYCILASGTYSKETLLVLSIYTNLKNIVNYTTEQAILDGIVSDFTIYVHKYDLNNFDKIERGKVKKWNSTDKSECNRLTRMLFNSYGEAKKFAAINRMRFINSNNTLINIVNNWIAVNSEKRFLLFAADENTGLKFNLPMFNSKSTSDKVLLQFQSEEINQLCLIKKGSAGVTYKNLSNILITAINSNGENLEQAIGRSLLNDTEHSNIYIFVSTEEFQNKWLLKALEGVTKEKIINV